MQAAIGSSRCFKTLTAASSISRSPCLLIITGSITRLGGPVSLKYSATVSMVAALPSAPVLTARISKSENTASSCWRITSGSMISTALTFCVFCAVTRVSTVRPYSPCAANVFRSAWIPAPAPLSLPAIVRTQAFRTSWELAI